MYVHDFLIDSKANQTISTDGMDCLDQCLNKKHWVEYPHDISYRYNSKGFRDSEWPTDLKSAIWCVGDSFTLGLGQPYDHIWPVVLSNQLDVRTINISMTGASNEWIAEKVNLICEQVSPTIIIVQWSYLHRRQNRDRSLSDEERRIHFNDTVEDFENIDRCIRSVEDNKRTTNIIHSYIPGFGEPREILKKKMIRNKFPNAIIIDDNLQEDRARDYHHYDIITATKYVRNYISKINELTS
jgi:hypothetical protein